MYLRLGLRVPAMGCGGSAGGEKFAPPPVIYIPQRGVQWKQGVVIYMMLYILLFDVILPQSTAPPCDCSPL